MFGFSGEEIIGSDLGFYLVTNPTSQFYQFLKITEYFSGDSIGSDWPQG